ncbi:MAG: hypothetical protein C3F02_04065 [Parcubacteria group bacterium]|nr:MAG: hypothetical protein C3F02_04065 [Parcubacteria group bacterium]
MASIKFDQCRACDEQGRSGGKQCDVCFGQKEYFVSNNNFLYWQKELSYGSIFVASFKRTANLIINGFLIVAVILTIIVGYVILNSASFDPHALWIYLNSPSNINFYLWLLVLLDMYLYYRLSSAASRAKKLTANLRDRNVFVKHNIADSLTEEVAEILDKAWLYAKFKRVFPVGVWHLLYILLNDRDVRMVLARLGVGTENLRDRIDDHLSVWVKDEADIGGLTKNVRDALLNAYMHMTERQGRQMTEVDLLGGLVVASEEIKNFFYDFSIDENKIDNVITWVNINKELIERYRHFRARASFKPKSGMNRAYTAIATPLLNTFSEDLTLLAKKGYFPPMVARDKELAELVTTIESDLSSVILIGEPGVGKDSIVDGLANKMMAEEVPDLFQDKRLVSVSVPALISGATGSGVLEERFLGILRESAISGNIILYIDNIHHLVGVSSDSSQGIDLAAVLAGEIRQGNIIVIASIPNKEYTAFIEGTELGHTLKKIMVDEPDKNQAIKMMEAHVGTVEAKHGVYFTYDALEKIYDLSDRYMPDQQLPKKAIDLMDEVGIMVAKTKRQDPLVRAEDVAVLVSHKTNIPLTQVTAAESTKLLNLEEEIHKRIVGQDEAVKQVATALRRARAELRDKKRPIANLLFLGPTGVGKTELAKTVAEKYFGAEENMIRLDMSEYQTQENLDRLIGSVASGKAGQLTEAVRHQPFALLLLDEIEKAHPDILNIFLQVMEDGRLTDALGRTVDFTNLIIVATSNAGTAYIQDQIRAGKTIEEFKDALIRDEIRNIFRPEFLNRFDATIIFRPLTPEEILQITGLLLKKVAQRLEEKGIFFEATEAAVKELARAGFDPIFGARPLRRLVQEKVDNSLAEFLLKGKLGRRDTVVYDVGGEIKVRKAEGF